ncbi:DUF6785 family protein [Candidatus Poribacteria bacterium]
MEQKLRESPPTILRALVIGLILVIINCYWIGMGRATQQSYPTDISLFFNAVFSVFVLTILNLLLKRFLPRYSLSQGDLLIVYIMVSVASSLAGLDMIQSLVGIMGYAFMFATPENEWQSVFWRYIPRWLDVDKENVLIDLHREESTLYTSQHVRAWLSPILAWSAFLFALLFVMLCINVIVRKQWVEREKLSYPIIQLPLEMTREKSGFFSNRLMWVAFATAFGINIVNGLHYLFPVVPSIGGELYGKVGTGLDLSRFFTEKPWNAIGPTPIMVLPSIIGLAFFIPLDLAFSCWFFYLFWKVQLIMASAIGLRNLPKFPYIYEQAFGGLIGLCAVAAWMSRSHLEGVFRKVFANKSRVDDRNEPMRYRSAILGIMGGMTFITLFCLRAGMSIWATFLFFGVYFTISTAITRMRAELGSPVHDFHDSGLVEMMIEAIGTRRFGSNNLTMFSFFFFFNRTYRPHPMPHQLEGFKIAERARISNSGILLAMTLAIAVGALASFWAYLHASYKFVGIDTDWMGWHAFSRLKNWLSYPTQPNYGAITAMGVGFVSTLFLMAMRMRFIFWPFHPAGYAVTVGWSMGCFWFSIFVSWVAKSAILRLGGLKIHRKSIPFFLGLILGEFSAGSFWSILGVVLGKPMYVFLY